MSIRLQATGKRAAQAEVKKLYPQGGKIVGYYEDVDPDVADRPVYETIVFKRPKSMWRRKTMSNQKKLEPDYFMFEPSNGPPKEGE